MKTRTSIAIFASAAAASASAAPSAVAAAGSFEWQSVAMYAVIIVCALALFCFLCKLIKLLFVIVIMAAIAAAVVFYCVRAGYLDEGTVERLNPLNSEAFVDSVKRAGEWVGDKTRATVEKAVSTAVEKAATREAPPPAFPMQPPEEP